jgi:hypothetical protein
MAFADSARAVSTASVTAVRQTAKPQADNPTQRRASDSSSDLNAGIISSLNCTALSREGKLVRYGSAVLTERRARFLLLE